MSEKMSENTQIAEAIWASANLSCENNRLRIENAALREALGLLTTLPGAADVECGAPPLELAQAIHAAVSRHIEELGLACLGFQP